MSEYTRRDFLVRGTVATAGGLIGLGGGYPQRSLFQPGERGARSMIDARKAYPAWLLHAVTVVLILLGIAIPTTTAQAQKSYEFTTIAFLGDPAAGGGFFTNDFEPYGINDRGDVLFVADLTTGGEGVFLERKGHTSALARSGDPAPGGGTFSGGPATGALSGVLSLNSPGDVAFGFFLEPCNPAFPINVGLYRYSHASRVVTPVIVPCVTPAPQGGTFAGAWS